MKRVLALLLTMVMALTVVFSSFAEEAKTDPEETVTEAAASLAVAAEKEETPESAGETADEPTEAVTSNRSITFDSESYVIFKGKASKITATVTNLTEDAPKKTVLTWTSSDPNVVAVNPSGALTGKAAGKAEITAAAKDDESIAATVTVEVRIPVQSVVINEKNATVLVGGSEEASKIQLTTSFKPEDAYDQTGTWSSSNEAVATVDENGVVKGLSAGNAQISFISNDPGAKKAQAAVKVNQAVTGIKLSSTSLSIDNGKTATIKAEILPAKAATKKVTWSSSNENVATVSANGAVSAKGKGTATITCTAADGSGVSAQCQVNVISMVKSVKTSGEKKRVLFAGQSDYFSVSVEPYDATDKTIRWSSSDSSVASVDSSGSLSAKNQGKCKIIAEAADGSGKKAEFEVTVEPAVPITLESLGFGVFMPNLMGLTLKNHCKRTTITNITFDITLHTGWGSESGSYNLGKDVKIGPGAKKTIKRNHFGIGYSSKVTVTITGAYLKDGTYYEIPSYLQDTWSFSR